MQKKYVLGLDIGTTSAKAVIFSIDGKVVAEVERGFPTMHPRPGRSEQDPENIRVQTETAVKAVINSSGIAADELHAMGLSTAMHSLICCDGEGFALSPLLTWADGRSSEIADEWKKDGTDKIYLETGTPLHPMSPILKLAWMKRVQYEPYVNASYFFSMKEYLLWHWSGESVVDYSVASSNGFFNIFSLDWHEDALRLAGISRDKLSRPVPPEYQLNSIDKAAAERMGISPSLPIVIGGSDGPLANLGIGAIQPGASALTVGTSGAIRQMTTEPVTDDKKEIFCYAVDKNLWVMGGPTNNGAVVLQWLKELFQHEHDEVNAASLDLEALTKEAAAIRPGAEGLLFLPYLNGERAPYWDADARGSYVGLSMIHKRPHLVRAGMEGVIFNLYQIFNTVNRLGGESQQVYASGGFARSSLWLQMLADIFGKDIHVPLSHQSSAWGAAWYALKSVGAVSSLEAIADSVPMKEVICTNMQAHEEYEAYYETFRELYAVMHPHFKKLAKAARNQ
ncbi:gluconokinase [Alteribacillus sp. HJP-4]|uniref:gluconokinase n=1 Tax=Alteribacillus sp. HJP-4 TaxID=2775394 RepID=UPI0035CD1589